MTDKEVEAITNGLKSDIHEILNPTPWPAVGTFLTNASPDHIKRAAVKISELTLNEIHGGFFDTSTVTLIRFCPIEFKKGRHYYEPTQHTLEGWRRHEESPLCTFAKTYSMHEWMKAWKRVNT